MSHTLAATAPHEVLIRRVSGSFVVTVPAAIRRVLQWHDKDMLVVQMSRPGTLTYTRKPTKTRKRQRVAPQTPVKPSERPQEPRESGFKG